ncbi:MAG: NAD(P)H-dependent oxidoreductase, partial [Bacteroidetes bacterium]|nr:NAD(P)H-dependent oxidoreductase [Bacteroidota bacterium]
MHITVIIAHPNAGSYNHAIAQTAIDQLKKNGHDVVFHDLYSEKFDPCYTAEELSEEAQLPKRIESYCREIMQTEGIIIVHPNWWGQPPAILKGWVDRVLRQGLAYRFEENDKGEGVPIGLLKANTAIVLNTSNTQPKRELEVFGDPLQAIWKNCIFDLCGVKTFYRETFSV